MRFTPLIGFVVAVGACSGKPSEWVGIVEAHTITVEARVGGSVKKLAVHDGEQVTAGQVLVMLEGGDLDAQHAVAQAELDRATVTRNALIRVRQARGAPAQSGSLHAVNADKLRIAEAQLQLTRAGLDQLDAQLDKLLIRAPFAARVEKLALHPGDVIAPHGAVVTLLEDREQMHVRIDVPAAQIGRIALGDRVVIRVATFPDETFLGKVERVDERTDHGFAVRVGLVSGKAELRAGMAATILE